LPLWYCPNGNIANKSSEPDPLGWKVLFILFSFLGTPNLPKCAGMHIRPGMGELHVPSGMFSRLQIKKDLGRHISDTPLKQEESRDSSQGIQPPLPPRPLRPPRPRPLPDPRPD